MTRSPRLCAGIIAALILAACATPKTGEPKPAPTDQDAAEVTPRADSENRAIISYFPRLSKVHKKKFERAAQSFPISLSPLASCNYVAISGKVKPHKHVDHDEVFIIVSGEGILSVEARDGGIETHEVTAGSIFHIPRGVAHAFENTGENGEETRGINVFSPAYTKPDRVEVNWAKKKTEKKPGN